MPYFESGELLIDSLSSIDGLLRGQTDVLVVDDGSDRYRARDVLQGTPFERRVEVLSLSENVGIALALNAGLKRLLAEYEYVARLDCGDICVDDRIRKQVAFLDHHPDCALVGSWVDFVSPDGEYRYTVRHPLSGEAIARRMHINCAFTHPTVMFRSRHVLNVGLYPTDRPAAEDFAYFAAIAARHETANLPQVLVKCLLSPSGISNVQRRVQIKSRLRVIRDNFKLLSPAPYGLVRGALQLATPRSFTIAVRSGLASSTTRYGKSENLGG